MMIALTMASWKQRAGELKREVCALYFACRDPRMPWYAKALAALVVAYALSPIDLIPDFIPVLGYVDELFLIPLGLLAVRSLTPPQVLEDGRAQAMRLEGRPTSWAAAAVIVAIWVALAWAAIHYLWPYFPSLDS